MFIMAAYAQPRVFVHAQDFAVQLARTLSAMRASVREAACGIGGHEYLRHAERDRLFLRCADCGHETQGWRIDARVARRATMGRRTGGGTATRARG
jgi:hypothetical protein